MSERAKYGSLIQPSEMMEGVTEIEKRLDDAAKFYGDAGADRGVRTNYLRWGTFDDAIAKWEDGGRIGAAPCRCGQCTRGCCIWKGRG